MLSSTRLDTGTRFVAIALLCSSCASATHDPLPGVPAREPKPQPASKGSCHLPAQDSSVADSRTRDLVERARLDYQNGAWSDCVTRLASVNDGALGQEGRLYLGACQLAVGDAASADEQFSKLVEHDAEYSVDPVVFPHDVIERVHSVRERFLDAHGCLIRD